MRLKAAVVLCGCIWASVASAQELVDFSISQVHAELPRMEAYVVLRGGPQIPTDVRLSPRDILAVMGSVPLRVDSTRTFEESREGIAYLALVDVSGSVRLAPFEALRAAVRTCIDSLQPADQMAILAFGDSVSVASTFTHDRERLLAAVTALTPNASRTLLYSAIHQAVDRIRDDTPGLPNRRVLLVFSDGHDEGSGYGATDILTQQMSRGRTPIYVAGTPDQIAAGREYIDELHRLAVGSGGYFVEVRNGDISPAWVSLLQSIRRVHVVHLTCLSCEANGQVGNLAIELALGSLKMGATAPVVLLPGNAAPRSNVLTLVLALCLMLAAVGFWIWWAHRKARLARTIISDPAPVPAPVAAIAPAPPKGPIITLFDVPRRTDSRPRTHVVPETGSLVIGRDHTCDVIVANDATVAARHCELAVDRQWIVIRDLDTPTGTFVNGSRIPSEVKLSSDDIIGVGASRLRFRTGPVR